jgi:transcriptional regulator of arginine metabolism
MHNNADLDSHILNIIRNDTIQEQRELQNCLKKKGYTIPQATLSRRLKKLSIAKVSGQYTIIQYNQPHTPIILRIETSDFGLMVLQTHPGSANSLAFFLDQKYISYSSKKENNSPILGTIAGDDTVLLILKNKSSATTVMNLLKKDFPYL